MNDGTGSDFLQRLTRRDAMLVPGAPNALAARVIADLDFEAVYITGAGITNMSMGLPDLAFIGLSELAQHTAAIREVVDLPLIVDADTGFGNPLNVHRTVRVLERAGANAIQLEDQVNPKRCGHFDGKDVISVEDMLAKVHAACDGRRSSDFLIIARTDARAVYGFDAAVDRANRFAEAGADLVFLEATDTEEELLSLPRLIPGLHVANIVVGGRTPAVTQSKLAEAGFAIALYANAALQGAVRGMRQALEALGKDGELTEASPFVVSFAERQRLVDKPLYDRLSKVYATSSSADD